jgi:hypothetical protein
LQLEQKTETPRIEYVESVRLAMHVRVLTKALHGCVDRGLDARILRHVSEDIDRHFLRPSTHAVKDWSERHRAEVAHDEFE